jgi:steroid delta-isomerase
MAAASAKRREDWLAVFAPDAVVEDPVGPSMLDPEGKGPRGKEAIARFWDEFISTVEGIRFHVKDSFANGPCCANIAVLTMGFGGGRTMTVDCVIVYTVDEDGLITSLRAHWEPERAMATLG